MTAKNLTQWGPPTPREYRVLWRDQCPVTATGIYDIRIEKDICSFSTYFTQEGLHFPKSLLHVLDVPWKIQSGVLPKNTSI